MPFIGMLDLTPLRSWSNFEETSCKVEQFFQKKKKTCEKVPGTPSEAVQLREQHKKKPHEVDRPAHARRKEQ